MSILGFLAQSKSMDIPGDLLPLMVWLLVILTVASPVVALAAILSAVGTQRPARFGEDDAVWKFLLLGGIAVVSLFVFAVVFYAMLPGMPTRQRQIAASILSPGIAFLVVVGFNQVVRRNGTRAMGIASEFIGRGVLAGLIGIVVVLPWVFWLMLIVQALLRRFAPNAPTEHELFILWQQPGTGPVFKFLLIFGAVVLAPLFEETLFRGILQTGVAKLMMTLTRPVDPIPPATPLGLAGAGGFPIPPPVVLDYVSPAPPALVPTVAARWTAIVFASAVFAMIHTPWTIRPGIFLLALGLGYLYERTNNLWASIFMHMFFNAIQLSLFVLIVSH